MRCMLPLALFVTGCLDYGKLGEGFCTTALSSGRAACDDYENDTLDAALWRPNVVGGTLLTERYASGRRSFSQRLKSGSYNDPDYAYRGRGVLHASLPPDIAADAQLAFASSSGSVTVCPRAATTSSAFSTLAARCNERSPSRAAQRA